MRWKLRNFTQATHLGGGSRGGVRANTLRSLDLRPLSSHSLRFTSQTRLPILKDRLLNQASHMKETFDDINQYSVDVKGGVSGQSTGSV